MSRKTAGPEIENLIALLAKLPGLGPRSARRAALHLIKKREQLLMPLARALDDAAERIVVCRECGNVDTSSPCTICQDPRRDPSLICVVEQVGDLWALERAGVINARYHVLGGTLSPLDGIGPEDLNLASLMGRVRNSDVSEVLLALNATVEDKRPRIIYQRSLGAQALRSRGSLMGCRSVVNWITWMRERLRLPSSRGGRFRIAGHPHGASARILLAEI